MKALGVVLIIGLVIVAVTVAAKNGPPPSYVAAQEQAQAEGLFSRIQLAIGMACIPILSFAGLMVYLVGRFNHREAVMTKRYNIVQKADFPVEHAGQLLDAPVPHGMNMEIASGIGLILLVVAVVLFVRA